jgi:hypothetical protein
MPPGASQPPAEGGGGDVMIQLPKAQFDQLVQLVQGLAQAFQQIAQEVEGQKQQQEGAPAPGQQPPAPGAPSDGDGDDEFLKSIAQAGSQ